MAGWLIRLPLALLVALVLHGVSLWVVAQEMYSVSSVIKPKADPFFTRQITQVLAKAPAAAVAAPVAIPSKKALKSINRAQAAIENVALVQPDASSTLPPESTASVAADASQGSTTLAAAADTVPGTTVSYNPVSSTTDTPSPQQSATVAVRTSPDGAASLPPGLTASAQLEQGQWPGDTLLSYDLGGYYRGDLHGDATVQWTRDAAGQGDGYQVRIALNVGPIKAQLSSQGRVRDTGLMPQAYEEQWVGKPRSVTLDANDVILDNGRRIPRSQAAGPASSEAGSVQDAASQFVELGHRFATGRAKLAEGEIVRVWLARPGGLDAWVYDVGPAETVYLPRIGPVQAHHLRPRPLVTPRGSISAEMWFAPALQYLPVRIKLTVGSDTFLDLKVQKIEQR